MNDRLRIVLERLDGLWASFLRQLPQIAIGVVILGVTWAVARPTPLALRADTPEGWSMPATTWMHCSTTA